MNNILTWKFLQSFDFEKNALPNFRSQQTLDNYQIFKKNTKNVSEYINEKYLKNKNFCIEKNDFPYITESNVEHYVIWINKSFEIYISKSFLQNTIYQKMKDLHFHEYIYFENHSSVKTIPDILHYQIFFRK